MDQINNQIEQARKNLLDLTMFNRLLNHKPTKRRTLKIVDEIPREIYEILVIKEKAMEFSPKITNNSVNIQQEKPSFEAQKEIQIYSEKDDESILWELPPPDSELANKYSDRFLQTNLEAESLQKHLFYVFQESNSVLEEQGYTILFLALGILEWTESPNSSESRRAPLILIPTELERLNVRSRFKLKWTGEDIITNISLKEKLKQQFISLPDFEMPDTKEGIVSYFDSVKKSISSMSSWKIYSDIYLDFFSFTKFVMWKDLDLKNWPDDMSLESFPLIRSIFDPSYEYESCYNGFSEREIDEKLSSRDVYHIMDADPSQIAVIENIKAGQNLVVEGPPGTGKSQTITNLIAELLIKQKSVLFISQKMAALEVVKSRLDSLGLGDFCLELHSRKTKKKDMLKELERTINITPPNAHVPENDFEHLENLKSELNNYAKALREGVGDSGINVYELYQIKERVYRHYKNVNREMPTVLFQSPEKVNQNQLSLAKSKIKELEEILPLVRLISSNAWRGCEPENVLQSDEIIIKGLIDECLESLKILNDSNKSLSEACAINTSLCLNDITKSLEAAMVMADSEPIDRNVLLNSEWNEPSEKASNIIEMIESFHNELENILKKFKTESLDQDISKVLDQFNTESGKFLRFLPFTKYRSLKREINSFYKEKSTPKNNREIISDLQSLVDLLNQREQIREFNNPGKSLFGSLWKSENSHSNALRNFSKWITTYRKQILSKVLSERSADLINSGISRQEIEKQINEVEENAKRFHDKINVLKMKINSEYEFIFGTDINNVSFSHITAQLQLWRAELGKLHLWSQYVTRKNNLKQTIAEPILQFVENDSVVPEDLECCFQGNFTNYLLNFAFKERPALLTFIGELHEKKIRSFRDLDLEIIRRNRVRLKNELYRMRPPISGGSSKGSEAGILMGEMNRKRGHMPIRKLLISCGNLIQKIKQCFMMSPLSIAQFLDPTTIRFDVIIYDEASQVKPEDAIGSLLRGNQLVVMGDTKQLPPTTFFDVMIERDEEDHEISVQVTDMESILHLCKTSFPTNILKWHYRSKHESLIAVSNQVFYDNKLLIYPSPVNDPDQLGLKLEYLPHSIYDPGRSSVNRIEAKEVAKACIEHYKRYPKKSLGVGTFNIKQQEAILEEIELQLRQNPEMEEFFRSDREEHFFVKNLETIQGDERDVIFLSIGFGKDVDGKLSHNFGPLNKDGGYRRLNVLITRARERCVVFSNFKSADLSVDENSVFGLRALKTFLEFAEHRKLTNIGTFEEDTESPFEESVYTFLKDHGYTANKQIGCAGFRVDIGIIDSDQPGKYLMGIECDGAKYHSSPVARDRDRLRQQILEDKGWYVHRIWSTDWYRNRKESEKKLLEAVTKAREKQSLDNSSHQAQNSIILKHNNDVKDPDGPEWLKLYFSDQTPSIYEKYVSQNNQSLKDEILDYNVCTYLGISTDGELHEQPIESLSQAVAQVVKIEGPVRLDEVVRRIRTLWGLGRAGDRIYESIEKAARQAERDGKLNIHGNFLWPADLKEPKVRKRIADPPPKIDLICEEEIAEALKLVLKHQHGTLQDDLAIQASRLLGFQATRSDTNSKIDNVIEKLKTDGILELKVNGMLDLKHR